MALPDIIELSESTIGGIADAVDIEDKLSSTIGRIVDPIESFVSNPLAIFQGGIFNKLKNKDAKNDEENTAKITEKLDGIIGELKHSRESAEFEAEKLNSSTNTQNPNINGDVELPAAFGFLPNFLGDMTGSWTARFLPVIGGLFASLGKLTGVIGLAAFSVIQGIEDMDMGAKIAESVGVSNTAGKLTGLIFGIDKSMLGTLKNAGKYAAIGAAIGSVVPIVGTLAGALIGGAIGAVLSLFKNYVGFENLAMKFDGLMDMMNSGLDLFAGTDVNRIKERMDETKSAINKNLAKITKLENERAKLIAAIQEAENSGRAKDAEIYREKLRGINESITSTESMLSNLQTRNADFQKEIDNAHRGLLGSIADGWNATVDGMVNMKNDFINWSVDLKNRISESISKTADKLANVIGFADKEEMFESLKNKVASVFTFIKDTIFSKYIDVAKFLKDKITNFDLSNINILETIKNLISSFVEMIFDFVGGLFEKIGDLISSLDPTEYIKRKIKGTAFGDALEYMGFDLNDPNAPPKIFTDAQREAMSYGPVMEDNIRFNPAMIKRNEFAGRQALLQHNQSITNASTINNYINDTMRVSNPNDESSFK